MKKIIIFICLLTAAVAGGLGASGAPSSPDDAQKRAHAEELAGERVAGVPASEAPAAPAPTPKSAPRIVALDPAAVEILTALGARELIVGIAPPSAFAIRADVESVPSVGSYMKPNIEQIFALRPDVVLASRHSLASAEQLGKLGISQRTVDANSFEQIRANIRSLAELAGADAQPLLERFERDVAAIRQHPGKSAMVVFTAQPLMLFCGPNLISDGLAAMGLRNACTAREQTPIVSAEFIAAAAPDYIIYLGDAAELLALPLMRQIAARSRIVGANGSALLRASHLAAGEFAKLSERLGE